MSAALRAAMKTERLLTDRDQLSLIVKYTF